MSKRLKTAAAGGAIAIFVFSFWLVSQTKTVVYSLVQNRAERLYALDQESTIGQTVHLEQDGFTGMVFPIESRVQPWEVLGSTLTIRLRRSPEQGQALYIQQIPAWAAVLEGAISFNFPIETHSNDQNYYILISSNAGADKLFLKASANDAFLPGQMDINGQAGAGDLLFFGYQGGLSSSAGASLFAEPVPFWGGLVYTAVCLIVGAAIIYLLGWGKNWDWDEIAVGSLFTAVSVPPLVLSLNGYIWKDRAPPEILPIVCLLVVTAAVLKLLYHANHSPRKTTICLSKGVPDGIQGVSVLGGMYLFALAQRAVQAEGLLVPDWIDGFFHTTILNGIQQSGLIQPEALYPAGIHANAYAQQLFSKGTLPEHLLQTGIWASSLSGLGIYLLALTLWKSRRSALLCAACYWFFATFPAYTVSWSRYPFLLGSALMPCATAAGIRWLRQPRLPWQLPAFLLLGLALTHYGLLLACLVGLAAWSVLERASWPWLQPGGALTARRQLAILGVGLLALVGWGILRLSAGGLNDTITSLLQNRSTSLNASDLLLLFAKSWQGGGLLVWLAGLCGALLACLSSQQRTVVAQTALWSLGLLIFALTQRFFLPADLFSLNNFLLFLSLPLSLLAGFFLEQIWVHLGMRPAQAKLCYGLGLAWLVLAGGTSQTGLLNPATRLFSKDDLQAISWIRINTSPQDVFLINGQAWQKVDAPGDGGGWIEMLADRKTLLIPPELASTQLASFISRQRIDYIYLGSGTSLFNADLPSGLPDQLELSFSKDSVKIYHLNP